MSGKKITYEVKLIDFVVSDYTSSDFVIQMFGINEFRKSFSITIDDFEPFVYIKVGNNWNQGDVDKFIEHMMDHPDRGVAYNFKTNMVQK